MDDVEITYEITRRDFAEANAVIFRASRGYDITFFLALLGSALLLVVLPLAYRASDADWSYPYIVIPFVLYLFYLMALGLSPFLNATIAYSRSSLANRKYTVRLSAEEVRVSDEYVAWINQWPSFRVIRETKNLFIFFDGMMTFILAKRYFNEPQIETVRQLISEHGTAARR
jgi:YcxB-like protein